MKKQTRKLFCLIVSLVLLTTFLFSPASASENGGTASRAVIVPDLAEVLATADADALIPVSIWITETDIEAVEQAALEETGLNKARIAELYADGVQLSGEEIDSYIEAERRIYAERQTAISEQFLQRAFGTASMDTPLAERETFVSKYTPSIWTELTKAEIQSVAGNINVNSIYYVPKVEVSADDIADSIDSTEEYKMTVPEALAALRVPYVRDTLGYTGKGIKIGQIEDNIPDVTISYLSGADITCRPGSNYIDSKHAASVAGIMVSQDASQKGIVPDASLYSAYLGSDFFQSMCSSAEWLLDNGVNIINMSANHKTKPATGVYNAEDKFIDHLAINHSVHFINTAGNHDRDNVVLPVYDYNVMSPGMAYNAITVGAANSSLNGRSSVSRYAEAGTVLADKPDIMAPGEELLLFDHTDSGTSYSAPMVTGIAAQMMQANPMLKTCQDSLKACLLAAIYSPILRFVPSDTGKGSFACYSTCGAGLVDAQSAMYTAQNGSFTVNQYFSAGASTSTTKTYTFTVSESDELMRVALTWLQYEKFSSSDHISGTPTSGNYVNMDLEIRDPNGNPVGSSNVEYGNVEIVQLETKNVTGTYTITVTIKNSPTQKTYFSVAWW